MSDDHANTTEQAVGRDSPRLIKPPPLQRGQLLFLGVLASATLAAVVLFVWLTTHCVFVPAMGIAFLAALGAAILVYAFLGGAAGEFTTLGIRLGGSAAVFAAVLLMINEPLERQMSQGMESCNRAPHLRALLQGGSEPLPGGGRILLKDTTAIRNDPLRIRGFPGVEEDLAAALQRAALDPRRATSVVNMSEAEWVQLLNSIRDDEKRLRLANTTFAHIIIENANREQTEQTVLRGDEVVTQGKNDSLNYVCIRNILNPRDESRESEVILFTDGRCD